LASVTQCASLRLRGTASSALLWRMDCARCWISNRVAVLGAFMRKVNRKRRYRARYPELPVTVRLPAARRGPWAVAAGSLADAKTRKDHAEKIVGREFPGDLAQVLLRQPQLLGQQVEVVGGMGQQGLRLLQVI